MAHYEFILGNPKIYRAVKLEAIFPAEHRRKISAVSLIFGLVSLALYLIPALLSFKFFTGTASYFQFLSYLSFIKDNVLGAFLLFFGVFWFFWILDFYFLSSSRPEAFLIKKGEKENRVYFLDFGGARRAWYLSLLEAENLDIAKLYDFFGHSKSMSLLPSRLGLDLGAFSDFIAKKMALPAAILVKLENY